MGKSIMLVTPEILPDALALMPQGVEAHHIGKDGDYEVVEVEGEIVQDADMVVMHVRSELNEQTGQYLPSFMNFEAVS